MRSKDKAAKIKQLGDVEIPHLEYWNYEAGQLKKHQRVGLAWLYYAEKGLLADCVGLGKTIQIIALLAMLKERGQLNHRAVVIVKPAAILQWLSEFERFAPGIDVFPAVGKKSSRNAGYMSNADVILIGYQMFLKDAKTITNLCPSTVITDDVDPLRNDNVTAAAAKRLTRDASRVVVASGTPLQTRMHELYSLMEVADPMACFNIFGNPRAFEKRYVRKERITSYDLRTNRKMTKEIVTGYRNMPEFKRLLNPWYLRRTHRDLDDADLPAVNTKDVWLDLSRPEHMAYAQLKKGAIELKAEGEAAATSVKVSSMFLTGEQICSGLGTFDDTPDLPGTNSAKLDWLIDTLTGDLAGQKVVVFAKFRNTIRNIQARLDALPDKIRYVTIWGEENNPELRRERQQQFWNDPSTLVCIGTQAMEQSLNLQVSNILINIGTLTNPARMEQLMGRVRRLGSGHESVFVYNILTRNTQEERYIKVLERRQAIADYVWGESSDLFKALSPMEMLQLIAD